MTLLRAFKGTVFFLLLGLSLWGGGFLGYVRMVSSYTTPAIDAQLPFTEAIIVLTGGSERLSSGVDLLRAGKGRKLLSRACIRVLALGVFLRAAMCRKICVIAALCLAMRRIIRAAMPMKRSRS